MWWNNQGGWNEEWAWMVVLVVWALVWKGLALWRSAKKDQRYWFIALLLINSLGILPIIYLLTWGKEEKKKMKSKRTVKKGR